MNDRAVSITLNYVLGIAVATLLLTGIVAATGDLVEDRREQAVRSELEVIGQQVARDLMIADRLAHAGADEVVIETSLPNTVAGTRYTIEVNATATGSNLVLTANDPDEKVTVSFENATAVENVEIDGDDFEIVLADDGELEVRES